MQKLMKAKYTGRCSRTGAQINIGDEIVYDTITRTAYITNEDDTPRINSIRFGNKTFYRNAKGRCEDAPCCGCCTI